MIAGADYELLTDSAGMADRSDRAKLLVSGSEALDFLQGQVTNDVESLVPGGGCYAALLTHKGKLRTDMRVLRGADWVWIDTEAIGGPALLHTLKTYSLGRDVRWEDVSSSRAILSLIGPAARERLEVDPGPAEHSSREGAHGLYVTTDLGADVICAADQADAAREALGVEPVSEETAECVRIESGRPRLGYDMDADTLPEEAGINERAVSFTKGCYVGQETVARLHYRGKPNRHLRGLRLSEPAGRGAELRLGERAVGRVGSTCLSPTHGPIALGLVRREAGPGDMLAVGEAGATAQVVELPFAAA